MAGDWIPAAKSLTRKREVLAISAQTSRNRYEVAGVLLEFWSWVDDESADGLLPGMTTGQLTDLFPETDDAFWRAVVSAGWLIQRSTALEVANFHRWLGRSAKRRLKDSERKRDVRAVSAKSVRKMSASQEDKNGTTEQNRTEQNKHPPNPPSGGNGGRAVDSLDPNFDRFWRAYPVHRAKKAAAIAWDELQPDAALVETILRAIARQRETDQWRRGKIPNPDNWLRGDRWNDAADEAPAEPPEMRAERQHRERQARTPQGPTVPLATVLDSLAKKPGDTNGVR